MALRAAGLLGLCLLVGYPRVYIDAGEAHPTVWKLLGEALQLYFASGFAAFCLGVFRGFEEGTTRAIYGMWLAALIFFGILMLLGVHWTDHPALYLNPVPPAPEGS